MELVIAQHARDQMFERGIDEEQIKTAIERGAKIRQTEGYVVVYTYIRIAYRQIGDGVYKIKTVMVE